MSKCSLRIFILFMVKHFSKMENNKSPVLPSWIVQGFNVLDPDGIVFVFKVGVSLWKMIPKFSSSKENKRKKPLYNPVRTYRGFLWCSRLYTDRRSDTKRYMPGRICTCEPERLDLKSSAFDYFATGTKKSSTSGRRDRGRTVPSGD